MITGISSDKVIELITGEKPITIINPVKSRHLPIIDLFKDSLSESKRKTVFNLYRKLSANPKIDEKMREAIQHKKEHPETTVMTVATSKYPEVFNPDGNIGLINSHCYAVREVNDNTVTLVEGNNYFIGIPKQLEIEKLLPSINKITYVDLDSQE